MAITLDLPADARARLSAEAERRGITVDRLVAELAADLPASGSTERSRALGFVAIGASTSGRTARSADDMLAEGFGRD